jgi:hypothetical protein
MILSRFTCSGSEPLQGLIMAFTSNEMILLMAELFVCELLGDKISVAELEGELSVMEPIGQQEQVAEFCGA